MRVLVTGGAGYVGSRLVPMLLDRGHAVRVVDCGWFGLDHVDPAAELIAGDIIEFDRNWLNGVDAVVHLAGLSNDPMAAFSPSLNYLLNAAGPAIVAEAAKEAGVPRFVFSSTCSIYGMDDSVTVTEETAVNPSFPYAISKLMAESAFACLEDEAFRPIVLRKGTVVGWSPRMRFDLVTNTMVKTALTEGRITVNAPRLWRPLIDVEDACRAYIRAVEADHAITGVFNIAAENFMIGDLAEVVAATLLEFELTVEIEVLHKLDVRSYRVDTSKASSRLGFQAEKSMAQTVRDLMRHLVDRTLVDFGNPRYYNIEQFKKLIADGEMPWLQASHATHRQAAAAAN